MIIENHGFRKQNHFGRELKIVNNYFSLSHFQYHVRVPRIIIQYPVDMDIKLLLAVIIYIGTKVFFIVQCVVIFRY